MYPCGPCPGQPAIVIKKRLDFYLKKLQKRAEKTTDTILGDQSGLGVDRNVLLCFEIGMAPSTVSFAGFAHNQFAALSVPQPAVQQQPQWTGHARGASFGRKKVLEFDRVWGVLLEATHDTRWGGGCQHSAAAPCLSCAKVEPDHAFTHESLVGLGIGYPSLHAC